MKYFYLLFLGFFMLNCSQKATNPEVIVDPKAKELYAQAQEEARLGFGWKKALELYNQANELEPENPLILHARAQIKIKWDVDIESGFQDHAEAIKFSKDSLNLKGRYYNRALDYLSIGDICSACDDWIRSEDAENYLEKYCERDFEHTFQSNKDDDIELELILTDSVTHIISSGKSGGMSPCQGTLAIVNNSNPDIVIKKGIINVGLEVGSSNSLYLEAKDADGNKFHFLKTGYFSQKSNNPNDTIKAGFVYVVDLDVLERHHFAYPGKYSIRLCLRPSGQVNEIKHTYYSNWNDIEVFRK